MVTLLRGCDYPELAAPQVRTDEVGAWVQSVETALGEILDVLEGEGDEWLAAVGLSVNGEI